MSFWAIFGTLFQEERNQQIFKKVLLVLGVLFLLGVLLYADDITRVFVITGGALCLFATETLPIDLTALAIMVTLMVFGLVTPMEGVSGFSNSATITVLAMFVLSAGIQRTGLIHTLGRIVFKFAGRSELRQLLAITLIIGPISGFMNNTAAVAIMLPMILDLAKRAKTSATKLLIPLSFVSMAGGMLTLIGTSTNILTSSVLQDLNYQPIGMFEFSKLGIIILGITIMFFLLGGRFLLPSRQNIKSDTGDTGETNFLVEVIIEKGSRLIDKTLKNSKFLEKHDLTLVRLIRSEQSYRKEALEKKLKAGDIIVLLADQQRVIDLDQNEKDGIKLLLDFDETRRRLPGGTGQIIKVLVRSAHLFDQRSLVNIGFWNRFGAAVVGVHRQDVTRKRLADMKLQTGEILLIRASRTARSQLFRSNDFVIMETLEGQFNRQKMWLALLILFGVIAVAALGILPIMVSALAGVVFMVLTKCLEPSDLHESVSWDVIFLLAGIIPLGIAMQTSGAASLVAEMLSKSSDFLPPILILGLFYVITTLLTEVISNNAAVVLLVPVALSVADRLFLNPIAFVFVVMFAASTSFLTPVGYQTNTMVFGAGNYKFSDFIKVGGPLNVLLAIVTTILIAQFWGLERAL